MNWMQRSIDCVWQINSERMKCDVTETRLSHSLIQWGKYFRTASMYFFFFFFSYFVFIYTCSFCDDKHVEKEPIKKIVPNAVDRRNARYVCCVSRALSVPKHNNEKNPFGHFSYLFDCAWQVRIIKCRIYGRDRTTVCHLFRMSGKAATIVDLIT